MKQKNTNIGIILLLVVIGTVFRFLPHPANFAPITAIAIFGGAMLPRRMAVIAPVLAMIVSDLVIGMHSLVLVTWSCFGLIALASNYTLKKRNIVRGIEVTFAASIFFYLVTNFAVWASGTIYAHTWAGLMRCYYLALPFFRNTILGDVVYTGALFSLYFLAVKLATKLAINQTSRQI